MTGLAGDWTAATLTGPPPLRCPPQLLHRRPERHDLDHLSHLRLSVGRSTLHHWGLRRHSHSCSHQVSRGGSISLVLQTCRRQVDWSRKVSTSVASCVIRQSDLDSQEFHRKHPQDLSNIDNFFLLPRVDCWRKHVEWNSVGAQSFGTQVQTREIHYSSVVV